MDGGELRLKNLDLFCRSPVICKKEQPQNDPITDNNDTNLKLGDTLSMKRKKTRRKNSNAEETYSTAAVRDIDTVLILDRGLLQCLETLEANKKLPCMFKIKKLQYLGVIQLSVLKIKQLQKLLKFTYFTIMKHNND